MKGNSKYMKRKYIFGVIYVLIAIFITFSNIISVNADNLNQIYGGVNTFSDATETILSYVQWVGLAILVGVIVLKGIKYVTSAPEGKAEIKKEIVMLVIGAVLLLATVTIVRVIKEAAESSGLK